MAVKLRLTRMGRRHRPFFRLNAIEGRNPRDGKILEKLGHYDPVEKSVEKQLVLNKERIQYWLGVGAVPSETVANILAKNGIVTKFYTERIARRAKAKAIAHTKGRPFDETERIQLKKEVEAKAKAEEEAVAKAEAAEKAATEKAAADAAAAEATASAEEAPAEETEEKASE